MRDFLSLGIDIGTTTISALVVNIKTGEVLCSRTENSYADIPSSDPRQKRQDPGRIERIARSLLEELLKAYPQTEAIGITGQMHGIVYLDAQGDAVSALYTWQDQTGADICPHLAKRTGHTLAPGYGLVTHAALTGQGQVPDSARTLCTIMDYLAFRLCGKQNLRIHGTNAASLGFFRTEQGCFDHSALEKAGIQAGFLPTVTRCTEIVGRYRNIPVAVPIGDNQASFLGAVADPEHTALANFGTGSQISVMTRDVAGLTPDGQMEIRPFLENSWLVCGSALCGGKAYALLEKFFRGFAKVLGMGDQEQYAAINMLALEGLKHPDLPQVVTTFCGTRLNPDQKGSITGLGEDNFSPAALAAGTLMGMAEELLQMFRRMPGGNIRTLAASGNAVRKNPALRQALEKTFRMAVSIPAHREEASFGAALFAAAAHLGKDPADLSRQCVRPWKE